MAQSRGSVPVPVQKRTQQVELFVEQVHWRTTQGMYYLVRACIMCMPKLYLRVHRTWTYFAKSLVTYC